MNQDARSPCGRARHPVWAGPQEGREGEGPVNKVCDRIMHLPTEVDINSALDSCKADAAG